MKAARYCTLITLDTGGHPRARIVDPLIGADGSIWIATNAQTRKVEAIARDPRVTLISSRHNLTNDPKTWRPVIVDIPGTKA